MERQACRAVPFLGKAGLRGSGVPWKGRPAGQWRSLERQACRVDMQGRLVGQSRGGPRAGQACRPARGRPWTNKSWSTAEMVDETFRA